MRAYAGRDWDARKAVLREQILGETGLIPMREKTPLNPQMSGAQTVTVTPLKRLTSTFPAYFLAGNLYRPTRRSSRFPGILLAHGY